VLQSESVFMQEIYLENEWSPYYAVTF